MCFTEFIVNVVNVVYHFQYENKTTHQYFLYYAITEVQEIGDNEPPTFPCM